MSESHRPIDGILDHLVFAPLGLISDARTLVPQLAERGRMQVANARIMGRFAVTMGSAEASKRLGGLEGHVRDSLVGFGFLPPEVPKEPVGPTNPQSSAPTTLKHANEQRAATTSATTRRPTPAKSRGTKATPGKGKAANTARAPRPAAKSASVPSAEALAIPGYDSLAASQVVARLAGLRPGELDAVRAYELHHRGRKTILGRIAQLQAS